MITSRSPVLSGGDGSERVVPCLLLPYRRRRGHLPRSFTRHPSSLRRYPTAIPIEAYRSDERPFSATPIFTRCSATTSPRLPRFANGSNSPSAFARSPTPRLRPLQSSDASFASRPRNARHSASWSVERNSSGLCAWSIEPGPQTTVGRPASWKCPASVA